MYMKHLVITLSLVISFHVSAEVYKWVDENGNTHYSQSPPTSDAEVKKIDIDTKHDTTAAQEQVSKQTEKADALREERITKAEEKAKLEAEKKARQEKCIEAKKALDSYQTNIRLLMKENSGNVRKLTEEERQEMIEKGKLDVSEYCD